MAFKIKDLMINIASVADGEEDAACCAGRRTWLVYCRGKHTNADCSCMGKQTNLGWAPCIGKHTDRGVLRCMGKHTNQAGLTGSPGADESLEELSAIKAELQAALAEVDEEIKEVEESRTPKTVEEVTELQTKLKDALEELDKIKAGLEKQ